MVNTSGVVLAGGLSRRMGIDKRLLLVEGEPMLRRVAAAVAAVADELIVVVAPNRPLPPGILDGIDVRVAIDRRTDAGPLAGIEAGLLAATAGRVLVIAGDLPWLDAGLLRDLLDGLEGADAVAADGGHGPEPLLAAYRRGPGLAAATRLLDAGERRASNLLEELTLITMLDSGASTRNVNRPVDLAGGPLPSPRRQ
jgi:molybdenum cofactor guanylyltransferase